MTTQDPESGDSRRDQVIAGEYVLGVLSADDRRKVEARMVLDRAFAAMVKHWESNLSTFDESYEPLPPSPQVFTFWRILTLASVAGLVTIATFASGILEPVSERRRPLVAELAGEGNAAINLLAQYDAATGALTVTPVAARQAEAKSLEVWLIEGDNPAKSLGVLPQTGEGEIVIAPELRAKVGEGVTLALSVEPLGGSPTGRATGPVVAAGKTRLP